MNTSTSENASIVRTVFDCFPLGVLPISILYHDPVLVPKTCCQRARVGFEFDARFLWPFAEEKSKVFIIHVKIGCKYDVYIFAGKLAKTTHLYL